MDNLDKEIQTAVVEKDFEVEATNNISMLGEGSFDDYFLYNLVNKKLDVEYEGLKCSRALAAIACASTLGFTGIVSTAMVLYNAVDLNCIASLGCLALCELGFLA